MTPEGTPWPKNPAQPLQLNELVEALETAVLHAYDLRRKNDHEDIPWTGPEGGGSETTGCLGNQENLTADNLHYSKVNQGRSPLQVILAIALRLGCEEGRRIDRERAARSKRYDPDLDARAEEFTRQAVARCESELDERYARLPLPQRSYACESAGCLAPKQHSPFALSWCEGNGVPKAGWWCDDCRQNRSVPTASVLVTLAKTMGWTSQDNAETTSRAAASMNP